MTCSKHGWSRLILLACIALFTLPTANGQLLDSLWTAFSGEVLDAERNDRSKPVVGDLVFFHRAPNDDRFRDFIRYLQSLNSESNALQVQGLVELLEGRWQERDHRMDLAIQHYAQAAESFQSISDAWHEGLAHYRTGTSLINTGLYEASINPMRRALPLARQAQHKRLECELLDFLGDYHYYSAFRQENFDSALYYYLECQTCLETHPDDPWMQSDISVGFANVYRRMNRTQEADAAFDKAIQLALETENFGAVYAAHIDQAEVLQQAGQVRKALDLQKKGFEYVLKSGQLTLIKRGHEQLYYSYRLLDLHEEALYHFEQFTQAQDSLSKSETSAKLAELEKQLESEKKDQRITSLENSSLRQQRRSISLVVLLVALLLGLVSYGYFRLRKNLKIVQAKNREITTAQIRGQNIERKRMAAELHDNLNTKIAAVRWQLEAIRPQCDEKTGHVLDRSLALISDVYDDVRLISHNLMPETVEALGLVPALENLLEQINGDDRTTFHLDSDVPEGFGFGPITYHIYNIIFEMINNIMKHAEASEAWISMHEQDHHIFINVSDNGKGFEVDQTFDGYGLRNIASRLDNINGKWSVDSAVGKGTKYHIEIPLLEAGE
ncbi:MAG: hypothetical protein KTR24_07315 [Saprospiraceae bacterium]|nr:hypothetical protein [Saprospiraceae bacterium]